MFFLCTHDQVHHEENDVSIPSEHSQLILCGFDFFFKKKETKCSNINICLLAATTLGQNDIIDSRLFLVWRVFLKVSGRKIERKKLHTACACTILKCGATFTNFYSFLDRFLWSNKCILLLLWSSLMHMCVVVRTLYFDVSSHSHSERALDTIVNRPFRSRLHSDFTQSGQKLLKYKITLCQVFPLSYFTGNFEEKTSN